MASASKLIKKMARTPIDWGASDFEKVYLGHGFEKAEGANHTTYRHPAHPQLLTQVPRHRQLATGYAKTAVELIGRLHQLEGLTDDTDGDDEEDQ